MGSEVTPIFPLWAVWAFLGGIGGILMALGAIIFICNRIFKNRPGDPLAGIRCTRCPRLAVYYEPRSYARFWAFGRLPDYSITKGRMRRDLRRRCEHAGNGCQAAELVEMTPEELAAQDCEDCSCGEEIQTICLHQERE